MSDCKGSHGGGGRSSAGAAGRGRGGTAHPWPESASSTGLRHTKAGEGEERGLVGGGGGGGGVVSETGNGKWNEKERK